MIVKFGQWSIRRQWNEVGSLISGPLTALLRSGMAPDQDCKATRSNNRVTRLPKGEHPTREDQPSQHTSVKWPNNGHWLAPKSLLRGSAPARLTEVLPTNLETYDCRAVLRRVELQCCSARQLIKTSISELYPHLALKLNFHSKLK